MGLRSIWYSTPLVSLPVLAVRRAWEEQEKNTTVNPPSFIQGTEPFAIFAPTLFTPTLQHTHQEPSTTHTRCIAANTRNMGLCSACCKHSLMHVDNHTVTTRGDKAQGQVPHNRKNPYQLRQQPSFPHLYLGGFSARLTINLPLTLPS